MKVVIVAKTRKGSGACVGALSFDGRSLRLIAPDAQTNNHFNVEYEIGDVWEIDFQTPSQLRPPHVEDVIVTGKRRLPPLADVGAFISQQMPPQVGGPEALFDGLIQTTKAGVMYITERCGIPAFSTMFWQPDQDLTRITDTKRIRYSYPTANGSQTMTFVGFQEPLAMIPAGTLLRASLAHWWRPQAMPEGEWRCYVQLSGWVTPEAAFSISAADVGAMLPPEFPPDLEWADDPTKYAPVSIPEGAYSQEVYKPPTMKEVSAKLKRVFGFDEFRSLQREIIANVLQKQDSLAIMPTGSGKSLCFQLPALLFPGLTVVVSPLISLMQDQVEQLRELGVTAVTLNSTLSYQSYRYNVHQIRSGQVKLLYIAPETLLRTETLALLDQCRVDCLTIDEAHCISEWGHDFRPEYRKLVDFRSRVADAVCIAVTATATERVQQDIKKSLAIPKAGTFIASFNRENLFLTVAAKTDGFSQTLAFLSEHREQSGIIYCSTRKQVDALTAQLAAHGWPALAYHAGLDDVTRQRNQHQFTHAEVSIIVATIAFGMGINKSNVRFIVHFDLPKNLESYYQQIGRAGRDGLRADCLLLFGFGDVQTINYFISQQAAEQQVGAQVRLKALLAFVETNLCRRRPLLAYFGEKYEAESCQACDNCLTEKQELVDLTIPAQKFLSCVKRTGEYFGTNYIIDILRGSQSKKILQRRHDRLSTYNIGREFSKREWQHLARQFIQQELLIQNMEYGTLTLTPKAYAVFKGEQVWGILPEQPRQSVAAQGLADYDPALFELLRRKRSELAREACVPPYVIFSDRSLVDMATYFPQSKARFANMYGVGEAKLVKYAAIFLPLIQTYCRQQGINEKAQTVINTVTTPRLISGRKRRMDEVAEAYNEGHTVPEIAADLGVKQSTVLSHLWKYVLTERPLRRSDFRELSQLTPDQQKRVFDLFHELGPDRLGPIFETLQKRISYDELHILRLHYITQRL